MSTRLYLPATYQPGRPLPLEGETAHYLLRVLRLSAGDTVEVFDGLGQAACATLVEASKKHGLLRVETLLPPAENESPLKTVLAQGISRGERMDWTLQKATELGVHAIQPLFTERVEVKLKGDKLEKKRTHWQKLVIAACEQSGRNMVPKVLPPVPLNEWLQNFRPGVVLAPAAEQLFSKLDHAPHPMHILVGPEGGLTKEEIIHAQQAGLTAVRLGPRILRTETAGCALLAAAQARWGDW